MGVFSDIHNALNAKLDSVSGLPTIYYPNTFEEPAQGTAFIRPTLLPAATSSVGLNAQEQYIGIYQIDIFVPLKRGIKAANDYADLIQSNFIRTKVKKNSTVVSVQRVSISTAQRIEGWWSCYVEVGYLCVA